MGNLGSVRRAFEECGASVLISQDPRDLKKASRIVLPGVGAFTQGMQNLKKNGWVDALKETLDHQQIPLLGICLGMQLLAEKGTEGGETEGLGVIPGVVKRLEPAKENERIPHVGWNELVQLKSCSLFSNISNRTDFYFVHSFHFVPASSTDALAETPYCGQFHSVVGNNFIFGVQFHPEKSQRSGFQLIRNFLEI